MGNEEVGEVVGLLVPHLAEIAPIPRNDIFDLGPIELHF